MKGLCDNKIHVKIILDQAVQAKTSFESSGRQKQNYWLFERFDEDAVGYN